MLEAQSLLRDSRAVEAMELLAERYATQAGEPDFDFAFALSAVQAGRASLAIDPLNRLISANPSDAMAHAMLGRAWFALRRFDEAQAAFEQVLKLSPPPAVQAIVEQYLAVIRARRGDTEPAEPVPATRWAGFIEMGGGIESNANRATDDDTFSVPSFGNVTIRLAPGSTEASSAFFTTRIGGGVRHNLTPTLNVFAGLSADKLEYTAERAARFDQDSYGVNGGAALTRDRDRYSLSLEARWFTVDNDLFRRTVGATVQWSRLLNRRSRVSAFFRVADLEFHPRSRQSLRDVTQYVTGGNYTRLLGPRGKLVWSARAHGGVDDEQASARDHIGRKFVGGRTALDWNFLPGLRAFGEVGLEFSDYGGKEPLFQKSRSDVHLSLIGGVAWNFDENWVMTPSIRYANNNSDIITSDYDSISAMLTLRRSF